MESPPAHKDTTVPTSQKSHGSITISFSGIDGAGKSTQIQHLRDWLQALGYSVRVVTFWDDVVTLKPFRESVGHKVFAGDKGIGTPESPIQRRDKNVRNPVLTVVRLAFYLLDALALRRVLQSIRRTTVDVVIFDRYIYDELANLSLDRYAMRLYIHGIMKLGVKPHLAFVLDAVPEKAFARKPEYPLDFLRSNREAYLTIGNLLGGITVVPALPLEEAKAEVVRLVRARGGLIEHSVNQSSVPSK